MVGRCLRSSSASARRWGVGAAGAARAPGAARAAGAAGGLVADRLLGEPYGRGHPVAVWGDAMAALERRIYADSRIAGLLFAAIGLFGALGVGRTISPPKSSLSRRLAAAVATSYLVIAGRALEEAAGDVATALRAGSLARARSLLPALVGRDPTGLDAGEIARAVVESVAENSVDAVVAPAFWTLMLGAPGALGYRAINTLDAMVGHRSERYMRFGWASARTDDLANWCPARLTALLVAVVRPRFAPAIWKAVRGQARAHPSPNAGVAEAAFAAALGLRLGGTNRYEERIEVRPQLGTGRPAALEDITEAVVLARDVAATLGAALALFAVWALVGSVRSERERPR